MFSTSRHRIAPRMLAAWLTLVAAPPLLLLAIGWLWVQRQRTRALEQLESLQAARLQAVIQPTSEWIEASARRIASELEQSLRDPAVGQVTLRRDPQISQAFFLDPQGELVEPVVRQDDVVTQFRRAQPWRSNAPEQPAPPARDGLSIGGQSASQAVANAPDQNDTAPNETAPNETAPVQMAAPVPVAANAWQQAVPQQILSPPAGGSAPQREGWWSCFTGPGLQLVYYQQAADGSVSGAVLNRSAWLGQLIARLPDSSRSRDRPERNRSGEVAERLQLVDQAGEPLYVWAVGTPPQVDQKLAEQPLPAPLQSLRIELWAPIEAIAAVTGRQLWLTPVLAAAALAVSLLGIGWYALRSMTSELRNASQRVSFVNQVSHELRTPLTNIRLYSELLEQELEGESSLQRASVIRSEAERLSRLITNVLQLAKGGEPRLRLEPLPPDELIDRIVDGFAPALQQHKIEVHRQRGAPRPMAIDADVTEQILVNLLSNVQKYAADGGYLSVDSRQVENRLTVTVCDRGPGIPRRHRERIFQPFARLDDRTTSVAGTGIGLTIARQLAQAHGGDVMLQPSASGACFEMTIRGGAAG
jgi:signal transduction histidine kinase